LAAPAAAQSAIPKSQLASITQHIAGTTIDVVYRRPVARGRTLFGALVPWDRVWSPSADSAPRFTTSRAIEVNGTVLAAGTYSLWAIPGEKEWTWIFNSQAAAFHMSHPGEGKDVLRVKSAPETAGHIETLTLSFPLVDADSAIFRLHWGTTRRPHEDQNEAVGASRRARAACPARIHKTFMFARASNDNEAHSWRVAY